MNWPVVELGSICEFKYGKSLPSAKRLAGLVPVFGSNGVVDNHDAGITQGPTIIIGRKGSFGEVTYSPQSCWPIDTTYYVDRSALAPDIDLKWLYYQLPMLGFKRMNRSAAIPGLNREDAYRSKLMLPPLEEQRRIASVLSKADSLRLKRRATISLFDELTISVFDEIIGDPVSNRQGWPMVELGDLLNRIDSGKSPVCRDRPARDEEWGVLKLGAISRCVFDVSENKAISDIFEPSANLEVRSGDILFSRKNTRELVGACAFVERTRPRLLLPDLIFRLVIRDTQVLNPRFLQRLLVHPTMRSQVRNLAGGSAASMLNISKAKLKGLAIPLPPIPLQQVFAEQARRILFGKNLQERALLELDALFASAQRRAFKGELWETISG